MIEPRGDIRMAVFRIKPTSQGEPCSNAARLTCLMVFTAFVLLPVIQGNGGATSASAPPESWTFGTQASDGRSGVVPALSTFTVTSIADMGTGSLRDAITSANASGGIIHFAIAGPAPHVISLATAL